ncbi:glycosyltransferase family 2 protein [Clostridium butyricum]
MLSVIVPIYNGERYLKDFIENVQSQTYKEFELILVNDGSTDNTESICKKYEELDPRIVLINKKNEGAGPSRNSGLKIATGNYIMFIDCDDYFENNYFEILYDTIIRNKVDLVICSQKNVIGNKVIEENKTLLTCKEYKNKRNLEQIIFI